MGALVMIDKVKPLFWFDDEPEYLSQDNREDTANRFRAYRRYPNRYDFRRIGRNVYTVRVYGHNAIGIYLTA